MYLKIKTAYTYILKNESDTCDGVYEALSTD